MTTVEQAAREASEAHADGWLTHGSIYWHQSAEDYKKGFLAGHAAARAESEAVPVSMTKDEIKELVKLSVWERTSSLANDTLARLYSLREKLDAQSKNEAVA